MTQSTSEESNFIKSSVETLCLRSRNNEQLVQALKELESGSNFMIQISSHYDWNINSPGNGVRSFVKIVCRFLKQLEQKSLPTSRPFNGKKQQEMIESVSLLNKLIQLLQLIEEKRVSLTEQNSEEEDPVVGILTHSDSTVDHLVPVELLSLNRKSIETFLSMKPFWLASSMKFFDELYARLVALRVRPSYKFLSILYPKKVVEGNAQFTMKGTVNDIRNVWSFYGWSIMRPYVSAINKFKPKIRKMIEIPRQTIFSIEGDEVKFKRQHVDRNPPASHDGKVSCLFLHDNTFGCSPGDSLLLHLHGGGYVSIKPECHEVYLRRWASRLKGVPILSIDYSLSPEHRFPVALQEILDVYLFLNGIRCEPVLSKSEKGEGVEVRLRRIDSDEMVSLIGFKPKNIVLYGDSAGSNLAVSLMHVLKSLNDLLLANNSCRDEGTCNNNFTDPHTIIEKSFQIPYPSSVFLLYPFMSPTVTRFTPSRLFMAFDPVLPLGSLFALSEAYHPPSSKPHHHYAHSHESQNGAKDPWYRKGSCGCSQQRLEEIQYSNLGHFFNPLCGKFDDFKDTPLYIQVGEFDPLFDDAVCLAKKWKGPVKFEMMEGLTHGYLFNGVFSSACKKAIDLCNQRLLQAIFPHDSTYSSD